MSIGPKIFFVCLFYDGSYFSRASLWVNLTFCLLARVTATGCAVCVPHKGGADPWAVCPPARLSLLEGGVSLHSQKHLLLSQPGSLDQILSTCPILGGASIQTSGGSGGWGSGTAVWPCPPLLLPLLLFVALNLLDFSFAEEFESIMPTRESIIHVRGLTYDLCWKETVF